MGRPGSLQSICRCYPAMNNGKRQLPGVTAVQNHLDTLRWATRLSTNSQDAGIQQHSSTSQKHRQRSMLNSAYTANAESRCLCSRHATLGGLYLIDPVAIEHPQCPTFSPHALLCQCPQVHFRFDLCDTLVHRLAVHDTLDKQTAKTRVHRL